MVYGNTYSTVQNLVHERGSKLSSYSPNLLIHITQLPTFTHFGISINFVRIISARQAGESEYELVFDGENSYDAVEGTDYNLRVNTNQVYDIKCASVRGSNYSAPIVKRIDTSKC